MVFRFSNQSVQRGLGLGGVARGEDAGLHGLDRELVENIVAETQGTFMPRAFVPIHGDLHPNNLLLKEDKLFLRFSIFFAWF